MPIAIEGNRQEAIEAAFEALSKIELTNGELIQFASELIRSIAESMLALKTEAPTEKEVDVCVERLLEVLAAEVNEAIENKIRSAGESH